jgi:hypothetical protein
MELEKHWRWLQRGAILSLTVLMLPGCAMVQEFTGPMPWEKTTYDMGYMEIETGAHWYDGSAKTESVIVYKDGKNGQPYYFHNGIKEYLHESGGRLVNERSVKGRTD